MFRNTFFSLTLALTLIPTLHPTAAAASAASCESPALHPEVLIHSSEANTDLRIQVPSTGVLSVEFSHRVRVDIARDPCGALDADALVVERSSKHVRLAARHAGVVTLRVSRGNASDIFRAASAFTPARAVVEHFDLDGMPARRTIFYAESSAINPLSKTEPEHTDPDPDGLRAQGLRRLAGFLTVGLDLLDHTEPEHTDPDPDGLIISEISGD